MQVSVQYEYGSPYAGFWRRVLASFLDGLFQSAVMIVFLIIAFVTNPSLSEIFESQDIDALIAAQVYFAGMASFTVLCYHTLFESSGLQATLGKMAVGLKVTDLVGEPIGPIRAAIRSWPAWIYGIYGFFGYTTGGLFGGFLGDFLVGLFGTISCIVVAFTVQKQGLHDMMAGALVVRRGARFMLRDEYAAAF